MRDAIVKGGGRVRLEVPGHLFIAYAPVLLLLLRDDNISWTNRSARHLFFSSLSIHLSLNFFPLLFFLLFSSLFRPLRFVALLSLSLPPSRLEVGFIRSPYSPDFSPGASWLVRRKERDCRHPMPWEIRFSTEFRGYSSSSSDLTFHLLFSSIWEILHGGILFGEGENVEGNGNWFPIEKFRVYQQVLFERGAFQFHINFIKVIKFFQWFLPSTRSWYF